MPPRYAYADRRILRPSRSLASFASSLSSASSLYTTTSSRTQWGPGALAGKAILALGKATLRGLGAEWVIIFRRLIAIRAHLPSHEDGFRVESAQEESFMDGIFDDLLELSRTGLYPDSIRFQSMELILAQIASGATVRLLRCMSRWDMDDLILLMTEIIVICVFCHNGFPGRRLTDAYAAALPAGRHPLQPCISFISEVASQNEMTFKAALLSNFLDLVLLASRSATFPLCGVEFHGKEELRSTCSLAFAPLASAPLHHEHWRATLDAYWPFDRSPCLEDVMQHINTNTPHTWLILEKQFLEHEILTILELVIPKQFPLYNGRSATDTTYPTYKNFTLSTAHPSRHPREIFAAGIMSSDALWYFMRYVALGGNAVDKMAAFLGTQSHRHKVSLLSRITYFLVPETQEWSSRRMKILCDLIGNPQLLVSIWSKFLNNLAEMDDGKIKCALVEAAIIVILPLLTPEMKSWAIYDDLFRRSHYFPLISERPAYSEATQLLIAIVREGRMASAIGEPNSQRSCEMAELLQPIFM